MEYTQDTEHTDDANNNVNEAALSRFVKAEIDMQISTAKAYPRSITNFKKRSLSLATVNEDVAQSCTYALPRKEKQPDGTFKVKTIEGPSVRLAEIVVSAYGNLRAGARVVDNDGRMITAQGVCHDLESNTVVTFEVKRRITDKFGRTFNDDMQVVTGNAACAIAFRNAVFKVIPMALIHDVWDDVKRVALGNAETLVRRRDKAVLYFTDQNITPVQICDVLNIKAIEDIDLDKLGVLSGMKAALKNGEALLADLFAPKSTEADKKEAGNKAAAATKKIIKKKSGANG
jgi:hypothetical protein